jgi:hypothetical protein
MQKLMDLLCRSGIHNWKEVLKFRRCCNCDKAQYYFTDMRTGKNVWKDVPKETDCP